VARDPGGAVVLAGCLAIFECQLVGRSTFRDWVSERTETPRNVAEMALAHVIESSVEAAYRRGELMTKRALLMQRWATFATTPHVQAEVVPLRR
jgi:hypothetical protein